MEGPEHSGQDFENDAELIARYEALRASDVDGFFDVEEFSDLFIHFLRVSDMQEAEYALRLGLSQHPSSFELGIAEARLLLIKDRCKACLGILARIEKMCPGHEDIVSIKADAYQRLGEFEKAIHVLTLHMEAKPASNAYLLPQLAGLYSLNNNHLDAVHAWLRLHKLEPKEDFPLRPLLHAYEVCELMDEAIWFFSALVDKDPYRLEAWTCLADCYYTKSDHSKALNAYGYAHVIDPENVYAMVRMAESHFELEQYDKAIELFEEVLEKSDERADTLASIGECYEQSEDYLKAKDYYISALHLDSSHCEARLGLAICQEHLEEHQEALVNMETIVGLQPDNAEYWYIYAEFLSRHAAAERSEVAFERAIQLDEENEEYMLGLIDGLIRAGELQRALDKVQLAFEHYGDLAKIYFRGIRTLALLGQKDETFVLLEMLVERHGLTQELIAYYPEIGEDQDALFILNSK